MTVGRNRRASDYRPTIWAAGAAVYRMRDGKPEVLLVHRPRYNDWSLPKGKLDRGESFKTCAEREVFEESGVSGVVEHSLGTVGYVTGAGNNKAVRYWLIRAKDENFRPNAEVDKIRWFRPKKALEKVTYTRDEALLAAAIATARETRPGRILLVRHAHAGDKRKWRKPDAIRPISKKGHEQVDAIVARLVRTPINAIVSSSALRCEQSVGPLALRLGLHVETAKSLRRDSTPERMLKLIRRHNGKRAVLCSHGEAIGPLIEHLAADPAVKVSAALEWPKGSIWDLTTRNGRVVTARLVPPS